MTDNLYTLHAAQLGTTILPGVSGVAIDAGRQIHQSQGAGNLYARTASIARYAGKVDLTTTGLAAALGELDLTAAIPAQKLATKNLTCWATKVDDVMPAYTAGSTHEKILIALGLITLNKLSWSRPGEAAVASLEAWPLSADGAAEFWTKSAAALPTQVGTDADYDLDSLTIGGTGYNLITDLELSPSSNPAPEWPARGIDPTFIRQAPATGPISIGMSFRSEDRSLLRTAGQHFSGGAVVSVVAVFKNFAPGAARGASTVTVTLTGLVHVAQATDARPGSVAVSVLGVSANGTTSPLSIVLA